MANSRQQREQPLQVSSESLIELGDESDAFSRGGNRLCFVHPEHTDRCIKTLRPDRSPSIKRSLKAFPKNLKPLSTFDDNLQEFKVYRKIQRYVGEAAFELVPRCHGFVDTNFGPGLVSQLIRDDDQQISITLKQYLWTHGRVDAIENCLRNFASQWCELGVPSRNLLLHNVVVRCQNGTPQQLIVIDGLGWPDVFPLAYWIAPLARRKAGRRIDQLYRAVDQLLEKQQSNADYGYHGWLEREKRKQKPQS